MKNIEDDKFFMTITIHDKEVTASSFMELAHFLESMRLVANKDIRVNFDYTPIKMTGTTAIFSPIAKIYFKLFCKNGKLGNLHLVRNNE